MDIIGFTVYGTDGIYDEYSGWVGKDDVIGRKVDSANSKGKKTWMIETWLTLETNPTAPFKWREPLDAKWMRVISYYAKSIMLKELLYSLQ